MLVLFLGSRPVLAAGTGTLKGFVFDRETKAGLPGASVLVKGTSIGASTDLNGAFTIYNVPSGRQTMFISYVGYESMNVEVNISEGQTLNRNFELQPTAVQGKLVVVTAQALGQIQAINQQLSSNTIVNVVSAAKIQELPDFNAAEAIGRLPGISTLRSSGEATQVVIRGIAPQYNLVSIDGITLAATSKYNRAVDLTMITPYMLQSIDVYKALTPDMNADAIGGVVNMQLREAPPQLHTDLMWQSGYTAKTSKYGNYKTVAAISDRFFNNKLGVYALFNAESYDRSADNMTAGYRVESQAAAGYSPVKTTALGLNRHFETRNRYGGNLILDYKLPSGSIQFLNMLSRLGSNYTDYFTNYDFVGLALNWNYQRGNANTDVAVNALQGRYDFGFMAMDISAANSYSRNLNPQVPNYIFSEGQAIKGPIPINVRPDNLWQLATDQTSQARFDTSKAYLSQLGYNSYDYKENDQVYSANFKIPFSVTPAVSGFLKVGGKFRYNFRVNNENAPYMQLRYQGSDVVPSLIRQYSTLPFDSSQFGFYIYGFTNHDPNLTGDFLSNRFGTLLWAPQTGTLDKMTQYATQNFQTAVNWHDGAYENEINDYKNVERYYATYAMTEFDLGPDITIVGGVRYEKDAQLFQADSVKQYQNSRQAVSHIVTAYPNNQYWLPMVQGKYSFASWGDVRYSFTKTLARPDFTQLSPYENSDLNGAYLNAGNPDLQPAVSYNHDLMVTIHSNDLGLFSVGAFYKTISNFSYTIQYPLYPYSTVAGFDTLQQHAFATQGAKLTTFYNNPYKAFLKGVEVDLQTRLWYLPFPINGLVLGVNYTHLKSSTYYPLLLVKTIPGRPPKNILADSSRAGRLLNQPDDILNGFIGYDYAGFSARLSFLYQGSAVSGIGVRVEQDGYTRDYFRMDASVRQMLPIRGLQVYFDVNNINSRTDISAQQTIGGFTSEQYYGLTADIGLRYTL